MPINKNIPKNRDPLDDFFREGLESQRIEPSGKVWKGIEKKYLNLKGGSSKTRNIVILIPILLLLSIGISPVFIFNNVDQNGIETTNIQTQNNQIKLNENPENIQVDNIKSTQQEKIQTINKEEIKDDIKPTIIPEISENISDIISQENNTFLIESNKPGEEAIRARIEYELFKIKFLAIKGIPYNKQYQAPYPRSIDFKPIIIKDDYGQRANISFGIHLTPGITYYRSRAEKFFGALDMNVSWDISDLSIETGLGLSYELDNSDYYINYESFDSVGFYYNITSFSYDPVNDSVIYNKSAVNVYDSIEHHTITTTTTEYMYLQIPFGLKYRFIDYNRISFTVRAGGIVTLLLYKDEPEAQPYLSDASIINIEQQIPTRLTTSWKYYAGIQFRYRITDKINFELEPIFMQYLKSPYERKENKAFKRPYSIGLRTGISINF